MYKSRVTCGQSISSVKAGACILSELKGTRPSRSAEIMFNCMLLKNLSLKVTYSPLCSFS